MNAPTPDASADTSRLRAYLLDTLSETERATVEARYFEDDAVYAALLALQDDLVDAYARDELDLDDRSRLEKTLLATEDGRARLRFARALATVAQADAENVTLARTARPTPAIAAAPADRSSRDGVRRWPALGLAAAALLAITTSTTIWLTYENARLRRQATPVESAPSPEPPAPSVERPGPIDTPGVAVATLTSTRTRGSGTAARVTLPRDIVVLRLSLVLADEVPAVDVTVEGPRGSVADLRGVRRSVAGTFDVLLDAAALESGAHEILVWAGQGDGRTLVGTYACEIGRR
ncbi:MAG: hypothetical protein U0Q12_19395 [Vicinamibacterales bacterium]